MPRKPMTNLDSILKFRDITLPTKVCLVKVIIFPVVSHIWMWELKYKESWEPENWFFRTVVWEKTLESPLDCKEIKPVNPERKSVLNIHWVLASAAHILNIHWKDWGWTPILWSSDGKKGLIGKDPDAGKDWRQEEKRTTEDEMVGWHHWLNGHEFEWAPGVGDGQGSLQCCSLCGHKESDLTEWLNWTELILTISCYLTVSPF